MLRSASASFYTKRLPQRERGERESHTHARTHAHIDAESKDTERERERTRRGWTVVHITGFKFGIK